MKNKNPLQPEDQPALPRRDLLTWMATAGAALGLGTSEHAEPQARSASSAASLPANLGTLAKFRDYKNKRASSYDRTGANADFIVLEPGQTATLLKDRK